ncbi:MAG TPA: hypothetical protein GX719_10395 [Gammaproteobacteria bacterium]|nr:hypothetical protein [Gammaproteobacteria bacterium]
MSHEASVGVRQQIINTGCLYLYSVAPTLRQNAYLLWMLSALPSADGVLINGRAVL